MYYASKWPLVKYIRVILMIVSKILSSEWSLAISKKVEQINAVCEISCYIWSGLGPKSHAKT